MRPVPRLVAATHSVAPVERAATTPTFNPRSDPLGGGSAPLAPAGAIRLDPEGFVAAEGGAVAVHIRESAAAAYDREVHTGYDCGPGFVKEFRGLPD